MPRLGHKKSKRGCLRCKQRRVKCDERDPCRACVRHGLECVFPDGQALESVSKISANTTSPENTQSNPSRQNIHASTGTIHVSRQSEHHSSSNDSPYQSSLGNAIPSPNAGPQASAPATADAARSQSSGTDPFLCFAKFVTSDDSIEHEWVKDLELMHHYTSSTYLTLPRALEIRHLWQIEVPRLALLNTYLLHQLMATSAYHMAYLHGPADPSFAVCASMHQNKAVLGLQAALTKISYDNCHSAFAASSLLCICGFASYSSHVLGYHRPAFGDLLDVLLLIRGMNSILDLYTGTLSDGPLGKLFKSDTPNPPTPPILSTLIRELRHLTSLLKDDSESSTICREAIQSSIQWIEKTIVFSSNPDLRLALSWPICLSGRFLELLQQSHPMALAILAHYSVILQHVGNIHWYLSGWGERVINEISQIIDPSWEEAMRWPLKTRWKYDGQCA